jgi:hypothetical protein
MGSEAGRGAADPVGDRRFDDFLADVAGGDDGAPAEVMAQIRDGMRKRLERPLQPELEAVLGRAVSLDRVRGRQHESGGQRGAPYGAQVQACCATMLRAVLRACCAMKRADPPPPPTHPPRPHPTLPTPGAAAVVLA